MAFKTFDRVKLTLTGAPSPPTGTLNLSTPSGGFQTLSAAGAANSDVIPYVIEDGSNWEIGYGLYGSAGPTLSRSTIIASSNSGSAISCTANAIVSATILAEDLNQNVLRIPGGEWVPLDFASGTTSCLNSLTLHFAAQTFVMSAGNRLEIETYIHELGGSGNGGCGLYAMQGSGAATAVLLTGQDDGDWILYEVSSTGGSYNPIVSFPGSTDAHQTYTGQFKVSLNIVCLGSNSSKIDGVLNGWYTGQKYSSTVDLSSTLSIAINTDAVGSCSGRARLLV